MNKICTALDISQWALIGISLTNVKDVLNIILLVVSIGVGILSILLKLKQYTKDGKLDKEELEDINKDVDDLKNKLK